MLREAEHCWKGFLSVYACVCVRKQDRVHLCTCVNLNNFECQFEYYISHPAMFDAYMLTVRMHLYSVINVEKIQYLQCESKNILKLRS